MNKRRTVLLWIIGLIVLLLVSIVVPGVHAVSADCYYNCYWETACIVNHQTGCEQHFGMEFLVGGMPVCFERCSNPCSTNCFK
ncbi:MAG: hypothetical protein ABFD13_06590 [Candidatus Cryosericum sp.]|nr:hypothetical protein [bacterium]